MVDKVARLLKGEPGNGVAELKDLRGLRGGGGDGDGAAAAVGDGEGPGGRGGRGWRGGGEREDGEGGGERGGSHWELLTLRCGSEREEDEEKAGTEGDKMRRADR